MDMKTLKDFFALATLSLFASCSRGGSDACGLSVTQGGPSPYNISGTWDILVTSSSAGTAGAFYQAKIFHDEITGELQGTAFFPDESCFESEGFLTGYVSGASFSVQISDCCDTVFINGSLDEGGLSATASYCVPASEFCVGETGTVDMSYADFAPRHGVGGLVDAVPLKAESSPDAPSLAFPVSLASSNEALLPVSVLPDATLILIRDNGEVERASVPRSLLVAPAGW